MSEKQSDFIRQILDEAGGVKSNEMLPFLMSLNSRISGSGLELSDDLTGQLISQLTAGMSPKERRKIEMLHRLSVMLSKKKPHSS